VLAQLISPKLVTIRANVESCLNKTLCLLFRFLVQHSWVGGFAQGESCAKYDVLASYLLLRARVIEVKIKHAVNPSMGRSACGILPPDGLILTSITLFLFAV
jgi:hypothetical protein